MKVVKVLLTLMALSVVGWFIYRLASPGIPPDVPPPPEKNSLVQEVQKKIDSLSTSSRTKFCNGFYNSIKNDVEVYAQNKKIEAIWEDNLLKNLDYTYKSIFLKQAYFIFNGNDWEEKDLRIIRSETGKLMQSKYITNKDSLNSVFKILQEYDSIYAFIASARYFYGNATVTDMYQLYDFKTAQQYIYRAVGYYNLHHYINNSTRLQSDLQNIRGAMHNNHIAYLSNKVNFFVASQDLDDIDSLRECYKFIYKEFEIVENNNSVYDISSDQVEKELENMKNLLNEDYEKKRSIINNKK